MYEEYLSHFKGEITEDIDTYVNDVVFKNARYIFTEKREAQQYGYCTYCNKEFRTSGLTHKSTAKCPYCGGGHKVQSTAYKRKSLVHNASFVFFEKSMVDSSAIVAIEYFVTRSFASDYKNVKNEYTVLAASIFWPGKSIMLKRNYWNSSWEKRNSVFKVGRGAWFRLYDGFTSFQSIENAVEGTPFQYSTWDYYKQEDMLKFFELYSKYPSIEYLTKCGCEEIVREKLSGYYTYGSINWRGKTLFKVLKLTKGEFKEINTFNYAFTTFKDYIRDCDKLGFDMNDEHILFPKNLYNAHQNTINQIKIKENKELDGAIQKMANKNKKYCFGYRDIFIRPAQSSKELIEEGQALHHCVATYSKRYAEGETIILVIRKLSEPNKPYCTMEIYKDKIIQVRANYNKDPNNEVKEFIEEFKKRKLKNKRKKAA